MDIRRFHLALVDNLPSLGWPKILYSDKGLSFRLEPDILVSNSTASLAVQTTVLWSSHSRDPEIEESVGDFSTFLTAINRAHSKSCSNYGSRFNSQVIRRGFCFFSLSTHRTIPKYTDIPIMIAIIKSCWWDVQTSGELCFQDEPRINSMCICQQDNHESLDKVGEVLVVRPLSPPLRFSSTVT